MGRGGYDPIRVSFRNLVWNAGKKLSSSNNRVKLETILAIFPDVNQLEGQGNIWRKALAKNCKETEVEPLDQANLKPVLPLEQ